MNKLLPNLRHREAQPGRVGDREKPAGAGVAGTTRGLASSQQAAVGFLGASSELAEVGRRWAQSQRGRA